MNTQNIKEQRNLKFDKVKEIHELKRNDNKLENNILFTNYIEKNIIILIIINIFCQCILKLCILSQFSIRLNVFLGIIGYNLMKNEMNVINKFKHLSQYNYKIIK